MERAVKEKDASGLVNAMKSVLSNDTGNEDVVVMLDDRSALEATKTLLQSAIVAVNAQLVEQNKQKVDAQISLTGRILLEMSNVQCFEPRGRFDLKVTSSHILLQGKQFSVMVPTESVEEIICLPSSTSAKKEGEDLLAFKLLEPVKINNKDSKQLLLNLMRTVNPTTTSHGDDNNLNESAAVILAVQEATGCHVQRPQTSLFATCRDQKPYLKCYRGTQEGAIYPLQCGVVFIKPLLIIFADEIASLSAGRGGGAGNTRYVDLLIESTEDKKYEFTNIDREELPALQLYVKGYLEARAAKQLKTQARHSSAVKSERKVVDLEGEGEAEASDEEDDVSEAEAPVGGRGLYDSDSSDEDDEDYDPDASDSDRGGRKHKRKGCHSKGQESGDEEDDDNSGSGSDSDDSGGSSDDGSDSADGSDDERGSATSECSGDEDVRQPAARTPKQAAGSPRPKKVTTKPKPKASKEGDEKPKAAKKSPSKKSPAKKPTPDNRPRPGQPLVRPLLPGIPPVTATTGGLIKAEPGSVKAEGRRKAAVPVKREVGAGQTKTPGAGRTAGPVAVKSEPICLDGTGTGGAGSDDAGWSAGAGAGEGAWGATAVKEEVSREVVEVVDVVDLVPSIKAGVAAVKEERRESAGTVDLTATTTVSAAGSSATPATAAAAVAAAPASVGVKRTIIDMFAPLKKKAPATTAVPVVGDSVADLTTSTD